MTKQHIKQRRLGEVINVQFVRIVRGGHYWFELPKVFHQSTEALAALANCGELHGPFGTIAAAEEDAKVTLLGTDCRVTDAGDLPAAGHA